MQRLGWIQTASPSSDASFVHWRKEEATMLLQALQGDWGKVPTLTSTPRQGAAAPKDHVQDNSFAMDWLVLPEKPENVFLTGKSRRRAGLFLSFNLFPPQEIFIMDNLQTRQGHGMEHTGGWFRRCRSVYNGTHHHQFPGTVLGSGKLIL